jgi:hypothetical protein
MNKKLSWTFYFIIQFSAFILGYKETNMAAHND